jgi:creatinine amidohydrolase
MEANAADRDRIAAAMELPPENFDPDRQPFSPTEQVLQYQRLLLHVLAEVESLGFALGVLVAGHYPLVDHARAAVLLFNKRHYSKYHGMLVWACVDYLFLEDRYAEAGDHAAGWETSHLMALHPQTVDLSTLPAKGQLLTGIMGKMAPQDATAEFGRQTLDESAEAILREVDHRMEHPQLYRQHGWSLREGLWKEHGGA